MRTAIPQTKQTPISTNIAIASRNGSVTGSPWVIGATSPTTPANAFNSKSTLR